MGATDPLIAALEKIVADVRGGKLDPRNAAVALGLPYDQDIIMGIFDLALAQAEEP